MFLMTDGAAFIGRLLLSVIFVLSGFPKLFGFSGTVGYMAHEGLPLPFMAALVAVLVECVGSILLIVGWQTRLVGLVMAIWCVATAIVAHSDFGDENMMLHFLKNLAMAGGFLQLTAFGAGGWSLDSRLGYRGTA